MSEQRGKHLVRTQYHVGIHVSSTPDMKQGSSCVRQQVLPRETLNFPQNQLCINQTKFHRLGPILDQNENFPKNGSR